MIQLLLFTTPSVQKFQRSSSITFASSHSSRSPKAEAEAKSRGIQKSIHCPNCCCCCSSPFVHVQSPFLSTIPSSITLTAMSTVSRSTLQLAGRRVTAAYSYTPSPQLASSFASSSRVRLDSTPSYRAQASSSTAPSPASAATPIVENPSPSSSTPLASSLQAPTRPIPTLSRSAKPKFRVAPLTPPPGEDTTHTLTVSATRNNTVLTFADHTGPIFPTISAGTDKTFKNSQRASYEAAHQAALKMFPKIEEYVRETRLGNRRVKVVFNGLRGGQGREAIASAISGPEGEMIRQAIGRVEDRTGIKIGGTRGKRVRRL